MNCKVIGAECMKENCRQWNGLMNSCRLAVNIGRFLYYPWHGTELLRFIRYMEEIRPE